jgi:hypothetical protein
VVTGRICPVSIKQLTSDSKQLIRKKKKDSKQLDMKTFVQLCDFLVWGGYSGSVHDSLMRFYIVLAQIPFINRSSCYLNLGWHYTLPLLGFIPFFFCGGLGFIP